jgi:hypothetical protein
MLKDLQHANRWVPQGESVLYPHCNKNFIQLVELYLQHLPILSSKKKIDPQRAKKQYHQSESNHPLDLRRETR